MTSGLKAYRYPLSSHSDRKIRCHLTSHPGTSSRTQPWHCIALAHFSPHLRHRFKLHTVIDFRIHVGSISVS
jgi:hypothetical protein